MLWHSICNAMIINTPNNILPPMLEITIDNSHTEQIQEKDGVFTSTKKDKNMFHGIGIKNVRKVVDTLNGQIEITYTENTFHVFILVPNYI